MIPRQDPILIAAPPRSGTSLLALVLKRHGVWIGRTKTPDGAENLDIKEHMKRYANQLQYKNWHTPLPDDPGFPLRFALMRDKRLFQGASAPWLVKTSWTLIFYKTWSEEFPEATWLCPWRSIGMTVDSMKRHPVMRRRSKKQMVAFADALRLRQWQLFREGVRAHWVDADKMVSDMDYMKGVLGKVGIKADEKIIRSTIDRERWHAGNDKVV